MTSQDSTQDKELLERYRRASDTQPAAPSEAVRAAILAEGRRVAEQRAAAASEQPFDVSRRAANDSRWKITAFGTAGAALVAALLFAPRWWEHGPRPGPLANNAPAVPAVATATQSHTTQADSSDAFTAPASSIAAPKAESRPRLPQARQGSLAALAPAEKARGEEPIEKGNAQSAAERAAPAAGGAPTARSAPSSPPAAGYSQNDASAKSVRAARAEAVAEPLGLLPAAASGDTREIQALLAQGAALDQRDELGRTPLMMAVIDGRREAVRLLLARGADPNAADHSGRTPLQMARQANSQEIAALLEQSGARQGLGR